MVSEVMKPSKYKHSWDKLRQSTSTVSELNDPSLRKLRLGKLRISMSGEMVRVRKLAKHRIRG